MSNKLGLFIKEKPVRALVYIHRSNNAYGSQLSKEINTTRAHASNIVKKLKERKMVKCEKMGRKKVIETTFKGSIYAREFDRLLNMQVRNKELESMQL